MSSILKAAYLSCLLFLAFPALGQKISLTSVQGARLITLVNTDAEAMKLYKKLIREADEALDATGNPIARIQSAGKLEADEAKIQSRASLKDMSKLQALGFAFAATSNQQYSAAARRIILSWAEINQPTGAPIDETRLEPLFVAYDLTRAAFNDTDRHSVESWLLRMAKLERESGLKPTMTSTNNWNSHRLKIIGLIGFLLADDALIRAAVDGFKRQIEFNLRPDGSSLDFHERDALHYHCYDLEPLLSLAIAAQKNGLDLYHYESPSGASLPKSVAFLIPYCRGEKKHLEWVNSKVPFDRERSQAGESKFTPGTPFDPRQARRVLELASFFNPDYRQLVTQLSEGRSHRYPTWQMVVNEAAE